jgi:hypothetical protein
MIGRTPPVIDVGMMSLPFRSTECGSLSAWHVSQLCLDYLRLRRASAAAHTSDRLSAQE